MSIATLTPPRKTRKAIAVRYDRSGDVILPSDCEFVNGRVIPKRPRRGSAMSELSNWVGSKLCNALERFVEMHQSGLVFRGTGDQGYQCFPHKAKQVRKPDVSFLRRDLSMLGLREKGWTPEVPELIAEVLSPEDRMFDINTRILDFIEAGTRLIWVIDPFSESAEVVHLDGTKRLLRRDGVLDGEDVLPGLKIPLASILPPRAGA
jgi:hypothetical protein